MKIIHWPRGTGRTTKLCEMAIRENAVVITATHVHAENLRRRFGVDAYAYGMFVSGSMPSIGDRPVYVDDVDQLLAYVLGAPVDTATTCQTDPLIEAVHFSKPI
jgi:hypothetical protein